MKDELSATGGSDDGNWDAGSEPVIWCKSHDKRFNEDFCSPICRDEFMSYIEQYEQEDGDWFGYEVAV